MNPKYYYHTPIKPTSTRVSCPVCHEAVYSRAGIHPQCAVIQSDPPRPKVKKPESLGLADQSMAATDRPGADIAVEAPMGDRAPAADRPALPPTADGGRTRAERLGPGKGTYARFIR